MFGFPLMSIGEAVLSIERGEGVVSVSFISWSEESGGKEKDRFLLSKIFPPLQTLPSISGFGCFCNDEGLTRYHITNKK